MTNLKKIQPDVDTRMVANLEHYIAELKAGNITDVVIVAVNRASEAVEYNASASFDDAWRLLGALDYAKHQTLATIGGFTDG